MFCKKISNLIRNQALHRQISRSFTDLHPKCAPNGPELHKTVRTVQEDISKFPPNVQAFKRKQMMFQRDDSQPVWLKTPMDRILSQTTFALSILGLLCVIHLIYTLIFPKEEDKPKIPE